MKLDLFLPVFMKWLMEGWEGGGGLPSVALRLGLGGRAWKKIKIAQNRLSDILITWVTSKIYIELPLTIRHLTVNVLLNAKNTFDFLYYRNQISVWALFLVMNIVRKKSFSFSSSSKNVDLLIVPFLIDLSLWSFFFVVFLFFYSMVSHSSIIFLFHSFLLLQKIYWYFKLLWVPFSSHFY